MRTLIELDNFCSILQFKPNRHRSCHKQARHQEDAGKTSRKSLGIFMVLMVKHIQCILSNRGLYRRLWYDQGLGEACDIKESEKPYPTPQLTRFKATFVKVFSRQDLRDDSRSLSDPDARVGRNSKTYKLCYKLHMAVDAKSEMPLAVIVAPVNDNEKKHVPVLFSKALRATVCLLITDSEYSCRKLRSAYSAAVRVVTPYPANQVRKQRGLLRVDRFFRTH